MSLISVPLPPEPFDFCATVTDHGWYLLAPWRWRPADQKLERVEQLPSGRVVLLTVWQDGSSLKIESDQQLDPAEVEHVTVGIKRTLRLDQSSKPFYAMAASATDQTLWHSVKNGRGRLMRCPTLFEDVIKMICTTNITWSQTEQMAQRICDVLGSPLPSAPARTAFPTAEQVAAAGDAIFTGQVRLGYRNGSVQHLAQQIVMGDLGLEQLNYTELRGVDLRKELQKLKGVGPYAAAALAGLLGDYSYLPVDSIFRDHVRQNYFDGDKSLTDKQLEQVYQSWGEWKQLAYWFDRR